MHTKRETILMAILLIAIGIYLFNTFSQEAEQIQPQLSQPGNIQQAKKTSPIQDTQQEPLLDGENKITNLQVVIHPDGRYFVKFDYFFRGGGYGPRFKVLAPSDRSQISYLRTSKVKAERGAHSAEQEIPRSSQDERYISDKVVVVLDDGLRPLASGELDYTIEWPELIEYVKRKAYANDPLDELIKQAVEYNDRGNIRALNNARRVSEQILLRDPNYAPAYIELARTTLRMNRGSEGFQQAEKYLLSAKKIDPKNVHGKILLGFVYAKQQRFREAETEFTDVQNMGPVSDLWLWTDWGEVLSMQEQFDSSLAMYMRSIESNRSSESNDRAILYAYRHVLPILESKKQFDKMEA
ncbi:MAG: tetratricopeptide repeat protein, partial [Gammaproteobacteria bacterium]